MLTDTKAMSNRLEELLTTQIRLGIAALRSGDHAAFLKTYSVVATESAKIGFEIGWGQATGLISPIIEAAGLSDRSSAQARDYVPEIEVTLEPIYARGFGGTEHKVEHSSGAQPAPCRSAAEIPVDPNDGD